MKIFWLVFILILVFLLLNYGGVTQALIGTGGTQFANIIGTLQGAKAGPVKAPVTSYRGG